MSNEIMIAEPNEMTGMDAANFATGIFSSVSANSMEERLELYNAVSNAGELKTVEGKVIHITDVIIQPVATMDSDTGDETVYNRIVLVCDEGAFACASSGVETALRNLFTIVGKPTWNPALPMKVVRKPGRNGWDFTTLEYAPGK